MASGVKQLAEQIDRLPLDSRLKTAVMEGVENTDDATATAEAGVLRSLLDRLPSKLQAVRDAVARDRHRRIELPADVPAASVSEPYEENREGTALSPTVAAPHSKTPYRPSSTICPECGRSPGLEQFLGRLGITGEMVNNLENDFDGVAIDEYINTARMYLKDSGGKASSYAKENSGKLAAGVAALALGAGLIYAAVNRDGR
jgi:hypothetical protein